MSAARAPIRAATHDAPTEFFIVGCPRSGTTLLRFLLDAHPSIAVLPETHFGDRFVRDAKGRASRPDPIDAVSAAETIDAFCRSDAFARMGLDEAKLRRAVADAPEDPWSPLRAAMHAFAREHSATIVGEKTPSHTLYWRAIAAAFPQARFLMLERDPRAVVASWRATSWSKETTTEIAEKWRRYRLAMRAAERAMPRRCLEVRYESLVAEPEAVLVSVCAFLGADFEADMLRFYDRSIEHDGLSTPTPTPPTPPDEGIDNPRIFDPIASERAGAWRDVLAESDRRRIETVCGRTMTALGYVRESTPRERVVDAISFGPAIWRRRARRRWRESRRSERHG